MEFLSILEKLKVTLNLILENNILIILAFLLIFITLLRISNKINNRKMMISIYIAELIILVATIYFDKEFLLKIGSNLIDNIFLNFYFPSIYVYLFVFVITNIIFIYTKLNRLISKTYKTITNIYFLTFEFLFILLLNVIAKNNIDIFSQTSLFTNNNILVLLELSTLSFFLYMVIMSITYITNYLIVLVSSKKLSTSTLKYNNELEIINPDLENQEETEKQPLGVSFQELVMSINNENSNKIDLVPEISNYELKEQEKNYKFIDPTLFEEDYNIIDTYENVVEDNSKNILNLINSEYKETNKITLNDYKLFSNMLKTVIQNKNKTNLTINDILSLDLLNSYTIEEYTKFERILNSCLN